MTDTDTRTNKGADAAPLSVGLVGLGAMGRGMGLGLLRARHRLTIVAHRKRDVAQELLALGANEAPDGKSLGHCDAVVVCLPNEAATKAVLFGADGIAHCGRQGLLVLECSTLSPAFGRDSALRLAERGLRFADSPVTRGPADAAAGRLDALLGAHSKDIALARRVLSSFCERIHELGEPGVGYAAKLVNAFLVFTNIAAVSEALGTAAAAGIDLQAMLAIVNRSAGQSLAADRVAAALASPPADRPRLSIAYPAKDVRLYCDMAAQCGSLGALAQEVSRRLNACEELAALARRQRKGQPLAQAEEAALHLLDSVGERSQAVGAMGESGGFNELLTAMRLYHTATRWVQAHIPATSATP